MFESSWSSEEKEVLERVAKKLGIDLGAVDLAGMEATFTSIEDAASKIGKAVTKHVVEDLTSQQAQLLDQPQPCPGCQKLCKVQVRDRSVTTGDGTANIEEAACRSCSSIRVHSDNCARSKSEFDVNR